MGMLERMISNAIKRETGFNPRRLIRRVGGGNLLMAGGAALAGGLLAQQMQKNSGSVVGAPSPSGGGTSLPPTSSSAAALPPPPRTASASPELPPLPPVPGGASAPPAPPVEESSKEDQLAISPELRFAITRTMIAASLADGQLDAAEKDLIDEQLGAGEFDAEQTSQLRKDLVVPPGAAELASGLPKGQEPEVLLQFALLAARAHGDVSARERTWLQGFAVALGLEASAVTEAERELFGGGS